MARKITMKQLKEAHACSEQRRLFYNRFGLETTVTKAKVLKYATVFDWWWGRWYMERGSNQRRKFGKLCDDAGRKSQHDVFAIRRKYDASRAVAWNDYTGGRINRASYETLHDRLADDQYQEIAATRVEKRRSLALPFYKAYNGKL